MWVFFFFNDTATTEIYTLSLHDALPISSAPGRAVERSEALVLTVGANAVVVEGQLGGGELECPGCGGVLARWGWARTRVLRGLRGPVRLRPRDRKSTRLNSSHSQISYAVFCL